MRSAVGSRSGSEAPKADADCEAPLNNDNDDKEKAIISGADAPRSYGNDASHFGN